ncbi:uncharacterized protein BHQ10_004893 [Talaromyces amestolkiae]|uniref:Uncharacterized protein n=1 Tax=Talaromyces amestolkiae TaxID=1196081 RepID=A0A364KZG6_TALAM|nr:uncharacterized protein BHQ10_004893 [Talaromyces amestolkiae]RAO68881.1 hypothetical protein BHQ10_004893 [Talaromyces amestolkiae]
MTQIEERELFGGAIAGAVPQGWIDGSTIREVPDHQEMFLSPTTLSNLIFEINEYVPRSSDGGLNGVASGLDVELPTAINIGADSEDVAAAMYHILDICDDDDAMDVIREPRRVPLKRLTASSPLGSKASAYAGLVKFTTPRKQRREAAGTQRVAATTEQNAASGSTPPPPDRSTNNCHFLLVRLPDQKTDLLVFVNVPQDEFLARGDTGLLAKEEELADEIIGKFAEVIDVKDWGLFGSD